MAQQWPSFPSEQARRLQQFGCAPTFRSPFYQQPMPTAWDHGTVERCLHWLQHTVRQRNQPSFSWDRQRNQQSAFLSWDQKWSPLFWKGEILDMPGTYRLVQCARKIGRSWALILEGEYFGDKSMLTIRAELQPYPVSTGWRAPRNMYCTITESRTLSATVELQTAGSWREAATHGFPLPACSK